MKSVELPYLPMGQLKQLNDLVPLENLPPGQLTQPLPLMENIPAMHGTQFVLSCWAGCVAVCPVPLGQTPAQSLALSRSLNLPAGHALQVMPGIFPEV